MVLAALSIAILSVAQEVPTVIADVPFSFMAAGKTLPAGQYEFSDGDLANAVLIRGTKADAEALVITRLAQRPDNQADVIFDKVDNNYCLSELYVPGVDGYLFQGASGKHTHVHVKARKK